jgi:DNA-binding NarL/FixJ family response regulator
MAKKPPSVVRILVVDDFEPFRRIVRSMLREHPEFQVIAEAADGLAAVQKAEALQPDLILLDIGLPHLNGIEVARRIRKLSPESKILFVSQESSADVVQGALATGACGYVVKADAVNELLAAMHAVLRNEQFVGSRFAGQGFTRVSDERALKDSLRDKGRLQTQDKDVAARHEAQFYSDDEGFLDGLMQFVRNALETGNAVIVVATESHRASLLQRLEAENLDIGAAIEQGRYIALDAAKTLSIFMVNGLPDPGRFLKHAGDLIVEATKVVSGEHARVAACGECAPLLWAQGNAEAAIQLEQLWNEIATTYDVDILCGYPQNSFHGEHGRQIFQELCALHSAVHPS